MKEEAMDRDDLMKLDGSPPAVMPDGRMALLIRWPTAHNTECGFQVPGESDIRWYDLDRVRDAGDGALVVTDQC
jgi:hypothetical protein